MLPECPIHAPEWCNCQLLKALSDAAKAGTPGLETHPDYSPRKETQNAK